MLSWWTFPLSAPAMVDKSSVQVKCTMSPKSSLNGTIMNGWESWYGVMYLLFVHSPFFQIIKALPAPLFPSFQAAAIHSAENYNVETNRWFKAANFQHKIMIMPKKLVNFVGMGHLGCNAEYCHTWINQANSYQQIHLHELGHNLGVLFS